MDSKSVFYVRQCCILLLSSLIDQSLSLHSEYGLSRSLPFLAALDHRSTLTSLLSRLAYSLIHDVLPSNVESCPPRDLEGHFVVPSIFSSHQKHLELSFKVARCPQKP